MLRRRVARCASDDGEPGGQRARSRLVWEWASPVTQMLKHLPAMQEAWAPYFGREDPLEEGMATHSSILAWRIPWTGEPGGLQSGGSQRVRQD